jgi:AcrR family transcriptional regulator
MPLVAERAGLGVATAYRYFPSIDDLYHAYQHSVIVQLRNYSHDCTKTGVALFEDVVAEWARLLRTSGSAMVHLRSRRGFLTRLREDDELIMAVRDTWERPIRGVMRHLDVPDEHFDHALYLYNLMFDPREILDLVNTGLSEREAIRRLTQAYYGALRGWAQAGRSRIRKA